MSPSRRASRGHTSARRMRGMLSTLMALMSARCTIARAPAPCRPLPASAPLGAVACGVSLIPISNCRLPRCLTALPDVERESAHMRLCLRAWEAHGAGRVFRGACMASRISGRHQEEGCSDGNGCEDASAKTTMVLISLDHLQRFVAHARLALGAPKASARGCEWDRRPDYCVA